MILFFLFLLCYIVISLEISGPFLNKCLKRECLWQRVPSWTYMSFHLSKIKWNSFWLKLKKNYSGGMVRDLFHYLLCVIDTYVWSRQCTEVWWVCTHLCRPRSCPLPSPLTEADQEVQFLSFLISHRWRSYWWPWRK